jgi:hypothetical protein
MCTVITHPAVPIALSALLPQESFWARVVNLGLLGKPADLDQGFYRLEFGVVG